MDAFALKARKSCASSLDKSKPDWMQIYSSSNIYSWINKPKPAFKGFPNEDKEILSIKKSFSSNVNKSMIDDHSKRDAKMKELESELSTAVRSKNQLEDTIQIIDKYFNALVKETPMLIRIKEALESVVIPLARAQNRNKEVVSTLAQQIKEEKNKTANIEFKMKDYEICINRLQSKVKSQENTIENLRNELKIGKSPPRPRIPKLNLSRLMPKQEIEQDHYEHPNHSEEDEQSNKVPKLDLSLLHGQMQYQDEIMAKADEFSHSWRAQLAKEKRF